jgi:glutamate:GABA antiporter
MIKKKFPNAKPQYQVPGKKTGYFGLCLCGIIGCAVSIYVGFLPPSNIDVGTPLHYFSVFSISMVVMILPVFALLTYKKATH